MDRKEDSRVKSDSLRAAEDKLSFLYVSKWESFLENSGFKGRSKLPDMYKPFTYDAVHSQPFGI